MRVDLDTDYGVWVCIISIIRGVDLKTSSKVRPFSVLLPVHWPWSTSYHGPVEREEIVTVVVVRVDGS